MDKSFLLKIKNNPYHIFLSLDSRKLLNWLPDKIFLKLIYRGIFGKKLDLSNPRSFNEKMQWLKLNNRKEIYTTMVDKYEVKKYVGDMIGHDKIIPTIGIWEKFEDIIFNELPNQFVLKCTHDSGGLIVCKDKSSLNIEEVRMKIDSCLKRSFYKVGREWPYKNAKPKIIAEMYMFDNATGQLDEIEGLTDYKFYCFNGEPRFLYVAKSNFIHGEKNDLLSTYDLNWELTPFQRQDHDPLPYKPNKPLNFDKMVEFSKLLSKDIPFVRVDWYEINEKLYFGELTFFPGSGYGEFSPDEYNRVIGDWLDITNVKY